MDGIGLRINALREARKLSKSALARAVGMSQAAISQIESGETAMPRADHLLRIAAELGAHPAKLVFGEDSEEYRRISDAWPDTTTDRFAALTVNHRRLLTAIIDAFVEECRR